MNKSNEEIIELIHSVVKPYCKFELDDFYGDRGGIPYPKIEELDVLHFKFNGKISGPKISREEQEKMINKIKQLEIYSIDSIEIIKISSFGKYIQITLNKSYRHLINKYNDYLDFKNKNAEKINWIYEYLDEKIPEEFIGWVIFTQKLG
jgi:hypothetical protein